MAFGGLNQANTPTVDSVARASVPFHGVHNFLSRLLDFQKDYRAPGSPCHELSADKAQHPGSRSLTVGSCSA